MLGLLWQLRGRQCGAILMVPGSNAAAASRDSCACWPRLSGWQRAHAHMCAPTQSSSESSAVQLLLWNHLATMVFLVGGALHMRRFATTAAAAGPHAQHVRMRAGSSGARGARESCHVALRRLLRVLRAKCAARARARATAQSVRGNAAIVCAGACAPLLPPPSPWHGCQPDVDVVLHLPAKQLPLLLVEELGLQAHKEQGLHHLIARGSIRPHNGPVSPGTEAITPRGCHGVHCKLDHHTGI